MIKHYKQQQQQQQQPKKKKKKSKCYQQFIIKLISRFKKYGVNVKEH